MRRFIACTTVALAVMVFGTLAFAQHGEDHAPADQDEAATAAPAHPIGLPPAAINWADFGYLDTAEEYAAEHHVEPGPPVLGQIINFVILLLLLWLIARKPLSAMLQERSDKVRDGLVEAQKLLEEANEQLADYSARLERMDDEMSRLREEFIAAGVTERDRLVADAGAKAERMRRDADTRLQQEFSQLREELRIEVVEKAVTAATGVLEKQVTEADQKRLADDYVGHIEQGGLGR